jgi:hypothetical protein
MTTGLRLRGMLGRLVSKDFALGLLKAPGQSLHFEIHRPCSVCILPLKFAQPMHAKLVDEHIGTA